MRILIAAAALATLMTCAEMPSEKTNSVIGEWEHEDATVILRFLQLENDGTLTARLVQAGRASPPIPGTWELRDDVLTMFIGPPDEEQLFIELGITKLESDRFCYATDDASELCFIRRG